MGWEIFAQLIVLEGLPLAEKLWQKWSSKAIPTQADWDELRALSQKTPYSQMLAALAKAGIAADDPKAKELLELVKQSP
jgi:hypothetical protein